jgi:hypothetical protein
MLGVVPQRGRPFIELTGRFGLHRTQLLVKCYALSSGTRHAVANGQNLSANHGAGGQLPRFACA